MEAISSLLSGFSGLFLNQRGKVLDHWALILIDHWDDQYAASNRKFLTRRILQRAGLGDYLPECWEYLEALDLEGVTLRKRRSPKRGKTAAESCLDDILTVLQRLERNGTMPRVGRLDVSKIPEDVRAKVQEVLNGDSSRKDVQPTSKDKEEKSLALPTKEENVPQDSKAGEIGTENSVLKTPDTTSEAIVLLDDTAKEASKNGNGAPALPTISATSSKAKKRSKLNNAPKEPTVTKATKKGKRKSSADDSKKIGKGKPQEQISAPKPEGKPDLPEPVSILKDPRNYESLKDDPATKEGSWMVVARSRKKKKPDLIGESPNAALIRPQGV